MSEAEQVVLRPIAHVVGGRAEASDDWWGSVDAVIRVDSRQFSEDALLGLGDFSHLEVVYHFHLVPLHEVETGARHPRSNRQWPAVGIFAQRARNRPNRLGLSRCRLDRVNGLDLHVNGLDAVAGTPILDIKPYLPEFGPRGEVRQPAWSRELMRDYY